jgi:splicing factor 3A subunit 1
VKLPSVDGDEHLNGNVIALTVDALSMPLSEFKKLIKEAVGGLAANKQKISAPGLGFLTDKNSLAYYNVKAGSTLTLALKERGGRKK